MRSLSINSFLLFTTLVVFAGPVRASYVSTVLAANPLAYFRLEAASDTSQVNGYTSTFSGTGATLAAPGAPIGIANNHYVALDGSSGSVGTSLSGGINGAGTILAWVNLAQLSSAAGHFLYIAGESQVGNDFDLQFTTDDFVQFYVTSGSSVKYQPAAGTLVGQWHMVAATFDSTTNTENIYWDGQLAATANNTASPTKTTQFTMGASTAFSGRNFNGGIDEVAVWNSALTAAQVSAIYSAAVGASSVCSAGNPAPISGSTGAQGVFDPANTDTNQGLVWPAGTIQANLTMDTGLVAFIGNAGAIGSATLPGAAGNPAFPNGILNFTAVHLPPGITVNFAADVNGLPPPVILLSCQDVILDANSTIMVDTSGNGPIPGAFLGANGSNQSGLTPAGFGPRAGALPATGSLYPAIGGAGGNGGAATTVGGSGGPAFVISAAQRVTLNGTINASGLAGIGAGNVAQGGAGGSVRLEGLLVEGAGTVVTSGGADSDNQVRSPAGPVEIQAFLQDLFSGTMTTTPIRGNLPVQPIPNNLPTINIAQVNTTTPAFQQAGFSNTGSLAIPDVTLATPTAAQLGVDVAIAATSVPDGTFLAVRAVGTDGSASTASVAVSQAAALAHLTLNAGTTYQVVVTSSTPFASSRQKPQPAESAASRGPAGQILLTAGSNKASATIKSIAQNRDGSIAEHSIADQWMKAFGVTAGYPRNAPMEARGGQPRESMR